MVSKIALGRSGFTLGATGVFHFACTVLVASIALATSAEARNIRTARAPAAAAPIDLPVSPAANSQTGTSERRHSPLNWDAFIDVQGKIPSREETIDQGVTLNDAALYLSKDFSGASAFVELPFSTGSTKDNTFSFATGKPQAFVQKNFNAVGIRLGQYASFFGIENNDSINRFFADPGLMKGLGIIPLTHTGAQVSFQADKLSLRAQIANPNSAGAMPNVNPEFGAQARFDAGAAFGAFGIEYGQSRQDIADKTNLLLEFSGGVSAGQISAGAELDLKRSEGTDKQGIGIEALGTYQASDLLGFGARFDYLKDVVYTNPPFTQGFRGPLLENALELSLGPSYKLENDLTVRSDFTFANLKEPNSDDRNVFWISVSLVARL